MVYPVPTGNLPVPYTPIGNPAANLAEQLGMVSHTPIRPLSLGTGMPVSAPAIPNIGGGGGTGWVRPPGFNAGGQPMPFSNIPNPAGIGMQGGEVASGGLAGIGAGEAAAVGNLGRLAGIRASLQGLPFPKSTIGKAGVGLGISLAGNMLGGAAGGNDTVLGRFLQGAGTGGGLGAMFGPEGAVIGGIGLGAYQALFGGGDGPKASGDWVKDEVLERAGYSPEEQTQIKLMYDILKSTDKATADTKIGEIIMQDLAMKQQSKIATAEAQSKMLSSQALAAQFFQPFTQQMLDSAQQRYQATENVADQLPAEYRAVARSQNAAALDNANRVATAYQVQAQLLPHMAGLEYQKGLLDQISQQQVAQVMANMGIGGGGQSAGGSLTDLATQAAIAQAGGGGGNPLTGGNILAGG